MAADAPPPIWPTVEKLEPARLGAFLAGEHPQTAAVVLSKLAPQAAANVLLTLEKSVRGEIIKRMLTMSKIPETAVKIVEDQIRARLLVESATKDLSAGQNRVASVLNELDKSQLEEVMQDLEASGAGDLDAIRARLFAFEDILLLTQKARVTLFDGITTELVTAGAAQRRAGDGGGGAFLDRRAVAPHDRIRARCGSRQRQRRRHRARAQVDRLDGDQARRRGRVRTAVHADARSRLTFLRRGPTGDAWPNPPTRTARPKKRPRRRSATPSRRASCRTRRKRPILASFVAILIFTVFFARDSAVELSGFLASFLEKPDAWPIDTGVRRRQPLAGRLLAGRQGASRRC